jgi:quercetin dioxygenase-like cupin family protein
MAQSQQSGIRRTDLQQHDLGIPGREVAQARVDIDPGVESPKHSHPGEEIVYVIEGVLEYQIEGEPPATVKAGEVLFIQAGANHTVKNVQQRQRGGARHVRRRKGQAARSAGQVSR